MARYQRELKWQQWAGSVEALQEAGELALRTLAPLNYKGEPEEPTVRVEMRDYAVTLDTLEELGSQSIQRDLREIKSVTVDVGSFYGTGGMQLRVSKAFAGPGLTVNLADAEQTRFEGLSQQLKDTLQPRCGRLGFKSLRGSFVGVWPQIAFLVTLIAIAFPLKYATSLSRSTRLVVDFESAGVAAVLVGLLTWASPTLELLAPGEKPRFERWRRKLIAGGVTFVLGVIASVLVVAIYS